MNGKSAEKIEEKHIETHIETHNCACNEEIEEVDDGDMKSILSTIEEEEEET